MADAEKAASHTQCDSGSGVLDDHGVGSVIQINHNQTARGLQSRHIQMIALGSAIGTGLFVGSGVTLAKGGPAFLLAGYILVSLLVFCVVTAITEVATYLPIRGATMSYYGRRYVSDSLGFAMGWLYFYSFGILVPFEITAAGIVIQYWNTSIPIAVWISCLIVVTCALNWLPVRFYGESEFWFVSLKVMLILGLLILSFVLFWWGGPDQPRLGFHWWRQPVNSWLVPGAAGRTAAFFGTVIGSVFPFSFAPEMVIVTTGEMVNPRRNLPRTVSRFFWRIMVFYIGGALAISVICPSDDPRLTDGGEIFSSLINKKLRDITNATTGSGAHSSPFVVGIKRAGIKGLDSVVNAVILTSAWSSGNAYLYLSSRSLYSLSVAGQAPAIFKKCLPNGLPYVAVGTSSLFSLLAYMNVSSDGSQVFTWLVNLTNTGTFISWICCGIICMLRLPLFLLFRDI
jgi:amino acid transporter